MDSRGRLTRLGWLRGQPFWRDVLVCCSKSTPAEHLARLRRHHAEHIVAGTDRVDLAAALHLLHAGLVDEISLIVAPHLAGTDDGPPVPLLAGPAPAGAPLTLTGVEQLRDGHLWLRYSTRGATT